jgi:hypothetical protein
MLSFIQRLLAGNKPVRSTRFDRCRPAVEALEDRLVPYALSGYQWANPNVSVSFMPDGTLISSSYPSNLFAVYNAAYSQATWQREVARALQVWADVSNLNFHFVADNGAPQGTPGLAQGDSRFGDIRIGGYSMGSGILGLGWSPGGTTTAGDVELSTTSAFPIGSMPDLASVVMHEVGHGIGFNHSLVNPAVMEGGLWGTYPGPYADDIAGVQAMYGARKPDAYEGTRGNGTLATAAPLTLSSGGVNITADITNMGEVDYFKVTAPANTDGTLTVMLDASTISLLDPKVSVFNAAGTLLGTASASTYQGTATVKLTGLVAGQTYYLQAAGANTDVFGMGAYKLWAQFGPVPLPSLSINNVALLNGTSGTTAFKFTVTLSAASINPVTVQYASADGTATVADGDYTSVSGTLTFAPGQTQQTATILVNGDAVAEPNETFAVNLTSPTNAVLGTSQGIGTIEDGYIGPDQFDSNNTMATAHSFGTVSSINQTGLTLDTPTNVDYFKFVAASKATYMVSATPTQGSGTLGLTVYNAAGTQLATGQLANATVKLSMSLSSGQTYYLKVWSPTSSLLGYSLGLSASGGGGKKLVLAGWGVPAVQSEGDVFYRNAADDPDNSGHVPHVAVSSRSPTQSNAAASKTGAGGYGVLPATTGAYPDGVASQPSPALVVLHETGQQFLPVASVVTTAPAVVAALPDAYVAPTGLPAVVARLPYLERGSGMAAVTDNGTPEATPARPAAPTAEPADMLFDPDAQAAADVLLGQRAGDAVFADDSGMADHAEAFGAPGAATVVALALVLGGYGALHRPEAESRTRRRFRR